MKAIKIGLAIAVIGAIAFFVLKSIDGTIEPKKVVSQKESDVSDIQNKIDSINTLPNGYFSKGIYNEISYLIDDKYIPHPPKYPYGRLGETQLENDQQKINLTRNLYTAYVRKFLDQAFYVFNGKLWKPADLTFIRREYQLLQRSPYLGSGGSVSAKFAHMKRILDKYDEINSFISSSNSFSYLGSSLEDPFPIDDIRNKLNQVQTYSDDRLENRYVNNCARLHNKLNAIPQTLFYKHFQFLDDKIDNYLGFYTFYNSQKTYQEKLYAEVKMHIDLLDSGLYEDTELSTSKYDLLMNKWNADARSAYGYFSEKQNEQSNTN
jgi:hypothetical protein